ncbi:MAG: HD domain-containing protein, partial [Gammaproteobacteria bacterium]
MTDETLVGRLGHRFTEALVGATHLHSAQRRKGSDIPDIFHLLGVASIALEFGATEDEAIAALRHDVIEDIPSDLGASWARKWIRFSFGAAVLEIVETCTDAEVQPKPPWLARKIKYIDDLATASQSAILVSASDKLHKRTGDSHGLPR